ncbi:unnamed protein product [Diplocarpon coronariae]
MKSLLMLSMALAFRSPLLPRIYEWCTDCLPNARSDGYLLNPNKNNTASYDCLSVTYHSAYCPLSSPFPLAPSSIHGLTALQTCIPCLSHALGVHPSTTISPPAANPASLLADVVLNIDTYCMSTHSRVWGLSALNGAGTSIMSRYHSPIMMLNVTAATGPVPDYGT